MKTGELLDTSSVFNLASVSKIFTSSVILKLVMEGKLGLEDPARLNI